MRCVDVLETADMFDGAWDCAASKLKDLAEEAVEIVLAASVCGEPGAEHAARLAAETYSSEKLFEMLDTAGDCEVRVGALMELLHRLPPNQATSLICRVTSDPSATFRARAMESIRWSPGLASTVVHSLSELDDPLPEVRVKIAWALGWHVLEWFQKCQAGVLKQLTELVSHDNRDIRHEAASYLTEIRGWLSASIVWDDEPILAAAKTHIDDNDPHVRLRMVESLRYLTRGLPEIISLLRGMMNDENVSVRVAAASAFAHRTQYRERLPAFDVLFEVIEHQPVDSPEWAAAAEGLLYVHVPEKNSDVIRVLPAMLGHASKGVRLSAMRLVERIPDAPPDMREMASRVAQEDMSL